MNPRRGVSTFANGYKSNAQTKVCKRASTSPAQEKLFFKISFPSKIFKTATAQPTHRDQDTNLTMTAKSLSDMTFTTRQTERQLVTAPTQKAGLRVPKKVFWLIKHWFFKSSFVVKIPPFG